MNLENKVAVISGGNGGIGAAVVKALYSCGAKVYSIDIAHKNSLRIEGVTYLSADLTDKTQLMKAIQQVQDKVDILFLNSGVMRRGTIFETSEEDYALLFGSNLKASWMLLKYAEPLLNENVCVVQMSSGHALHPEADPGIYTLTKKASAGLAEILTITRPNFDVKTIYPGPVLTDLLLSGRNEQDVERISKIAHKPEYVAEKIIELITSGESSLRFDPEAWDYTLSS